MESRGENLLLFLAKCLSVWYNKKDHVRPRKGRSVPEHGSVFTIMKKNEMKAGGKKPPEVRSREQMEDRAFNRMLLWLVAVAAVEVVMLLINRFYIHTRVNELSVSIFLHKALAVFPVVGVVLFVVFLLLARKRYAVYRQEGGKDGIGQLMLAFTFLAIGVFGFIMRMLNAETAPIVLAVIPGIGVLIMVYYLYQKEFLGCALVGALGLLGLCLFRAYAAGTLYYVYLAVVVIVAVAGLVLAQKLKASGGVLRWKDKALTILQPNAAYLPYYLTVVLTVVVLLAPLALGAAAAYYAIWVIAAWLFILAVYFTSKLM